MTACRLSLYDVWDRAQKGPRVAADQYDFKILPETMERFVREHDIKIEKNSIIPEDHSLADSIYEAGYELLLNNGIYCVDTGRTIKISEDELKEGLKAAPRELVLGDGKDAVRMVRRKVCDPKRPVVHSGPSAAALSEDIFVKANQSYAQEALVEVICEGVLNLVGGHEIEPHSPYELAASRLEPILTRTGCALAGRPGMCVHGPHTPTTPEGRLAAENSLRSTDIFEVSHSPELKIEANVITILSHFVEKGYLVDLEHLPIFGGICSTVEQTAIASVAAHLATFALFSGSFHLDGPVHLRWGTTSTRETIQISGHVGVAIDRNTDLLTAAMAYTAAGPCTDMCLFETAAQVVTHTVSGREMLQSTIPSKGIVLDHVAGLTGRAVGEIAIAAAQLSLAQANEIVNALLTKYDKKEYYKAPPEGRRFQDCYDLVTVKPTEEHLRVYESAMKELREVGLPL